MMIRDKFRWLHRWVGIPLSIIFFVTLVTGALTAYNQVRQNTDSQGQTYRVTSPAEDAAAVEVITANFDGLTSIVMPNKSTPYYQVNVRGSRAFVGIADAQGDHNLVRGMESARGQFYAWIFRLHRTFLLGGENQNALGVEGVKITAWVAITAVSFSLLGLYLWWPFRSKFKVQQAVPMSVKRRAYFNAHLTSGLIVVGAIVILGVTGASLYFRTQTNALLGTNEGRNVGVLERPETLQNNWPTWFETSANKIPDGRLVSVDFPRNGGELPPIVQGLTLVGFQEGGQNGAMGGRGGGMGAGGQAGAMGAGAQAGAMGAGAQAGAMGAGGQAGMGGFAQAGAMGGAAGQAGMGGFAQAGAMGAGGQVGMGMGAGGGGQGGNPLGQALSFRFVTGDDWLSVPNSRVYIDSTASELIGVKRFSQNTFGQKLQAMLNPLHTGSNITTPYVFVMMMMAFLAALMVFSGLLSMIWTLLRRKRAAGSLVVLSKGEGDKKTKVTIQGPSIGREGAPAE